jgi:penicillin amidase
MAGSGGGSGRNRGGGAARSGTGGRVSANGRRGAGSGMTEGEATRPVTAAEAEVSSAPVRRRRFSRRNIFLTVGVVLILVVAGVALYVWNEVNKRLPTINGTAQLAGLTANVSVTRDKNGVPHISAANLQDLYMAQGYVHAQDRLYQMFFFRTVGQGRLSELISSGYVSSDRFLRIIGFRRAAEAETAKLRPDVRQALEWYSQGINAFVHSHRDNLPLELMLLGVEFEDWQPVDTIAFGKIQAHDLTETWLHELVKSDVVQRVGPEAAAQLIPAYPTGAPVTVPGANSGSWGNVIAQYERDVAPFLGGWDEGIGSNNWVVDGTKSTTGKPLLANDPHLGVRNPSIWYEIHLSTTDGAYDAVGFGFPGAPGIVTGHNQDIAWGVTNTGADVQDVFLEKLDEQNHPGQYQSGSEWLPLGVVTETIKVKGGGEPVTQTVRLTKHGPLLSDAFPVTQTLSASISGTYSIQWTAHEPGRLIEALYDLQTASNWEEFRSALSGWDVPGQNFVYADREGNIGYQMTGQMPIRKAGDGSVPAPGWTGEYDWDGYIPFDELPRAYNPPEHFIATANNQPFGEDYEHDMAGYWSKPWRIERIRELLMAKEKLSTDDFKAVLSDTTSLLAKRVLPAFTAIEPADARGQQAVDMLKAWDGNVRADSAAAAIYNITYHQVLTRTLSDELGRELSLDEPNLLTQYLDRYRGDALIAIADLLDKPDDPLWDDKETPEKETRDDILRASLTGALADLGRVMGDNMNDWQWGKLHMIAPAHEFSGQDLIGGLFTLSQQPLGGDNTTVSVSSYELWIAALPLQPFGVTSHQSYRMIIDLSDWNKAEGVFATGESGQPGSKFRENMYPLWLSYQYLPMYYDKAQIEANKEGVLTLTP